MYVEGSLRTRKYTDKNGVEKYATDIRADSMQMLGSRQGMGGPSEDGGGGGAYAPRQAPARPAAAPAQRPAAAPAPRPAASNFDDMDDDIPF